MHWPRREHRRSPFSSKRWQEKNETGAKNAAAALVKLGPPAIPALYQELKSDTSGSRAAAILAHFGAEQVPALIDVLKANDPVARGNAALALKDIGKPARAPSPAHAGPQR